MAPCSPARVPPALAPTWRRLTQRAAFCAGLQAPTSPRAQPARPVLLALGAPVVGPPTKEPLRRCCRFSQRVAFAIEVRTLADGCLIVCRPSTARAVASGSGALPTASPGTHFCEPVVVAAKFRRK